MTRGGVGLCRIEGLDQVGKVRDDLRMGRDGQEVGLHPVRHQLDPVPARRRGQLKALVRRTHQAGPRRVPAETAHRGGTEKRQPDSHRRKARAQPRKT